MANGKKISPRSGESVGTRVYQGGYWIEGDDYIRPTRLSRSVIGRAYPEDRTCGLARPVIQGKVSSGWGSTALTPGEDATAMPDRKVIDPATPQPS